MKTLVDNKSAIALNENPILYTRSKHINMDYHYIRKCAKEGHVELDYVSTNNHLVDVLTKFMEKLKFIKLQLKIGMRSIP